MEHWLPLFAERMDTLFDYLGDAPVAIEPQSEDAARERFSKSSIITRRGARRWSIRAAARSTSLAAGSALYDRRRMEQTSHEAALRG